MSTVGDIIGGAIGGTIGGIGSIYSGYKQNQANERMNKENLRLAYIQRNDLLKQQERDNAFRERQFASENKFGAQDRAFRERESAYQKYQDQRAAVRQRLQDDVGYRNNVIAMLNAAKRG